MDIKNVPVEKLIESIAEKMEKMAEFKPPNWADFVKTGVHKERPPTQDNWWWLRAASILRRTYLEQGIGVNRLRKVYGGRQNRGHKPEHKYPASGAIIRKIMQQLEAADFLKAQKTEKGRVVKKLITQKGRSFLEEAAKSAGG